MSWWGKILGGTFGFMIGGPLGALFGAAFGHQFDAGMKGVDRDFAGQGFEPGDRERVQTVFFTATFSVLGHLAKADGRVSEDEIGVARAIMEQMNLDHARRQAAIKLFNQGKQAGYDLDGVIKQFRQECRRRDNLMRMFIEILLHAAYADGTMHPAERSMLEDICDKLGFSRAELRHLEVLVVAQRNFQAGAAGGRGGATAPAPRALLAEAYKVLDVPESAPDGDVKRAYRRLMNQHHPDKLVAKGLPEEMMQIAKEKTQEIKAAYERVKQARGMK